MSTLWEIFDGILVVLVESNLYQDQPTKKRVMNVGRWMLGLSPELELGRYTPCWLVWNEKRMCTFEMMCARSRSPMIAKKSLSTRSTQSSKTRDPSVNETPQWMIPY